MPGARQKGRTYLCLCLAALMLSAACSRSAEKSLERAREAWNSRDFETAAEEYERYLASNPDDARSAEVRFHLANIYFLNLQRYEQARVHYSAFLAESPDNPEAATARERLAELLAELGRSYEAISEYEAIEPSDPTEARRIRLRIADLYYDQNNYSQALTEYERVTENVEYDQYSEQAYFREASIYHLARSQYELALPVYEKLASRTGDPDLRRRALLGLADCHAGLYQFEKAIQILRDIQDSGHDAYIARRITELEQQRREVLRAPQVNGPHAQ